MKTQKWGMVVVLLVSLFLLAMPVGAQETAGPESTETAAAQQTVDAPVILGTEAADGSGDVTVIVNNPPAEEETSTETPAPSTGNDPLAIVIVVVLAVLLVAGGIWGARLTGLLATMVPPETAASIYQSGVRFGLQVALNQAATTATPLDDEFFMGMAKDRGLNVVKRIDGTYEVSYTPPVTSAG